MTVDEAKKLKVGQRVIWESDGSRGTIRDRSYAGIVIAWDDQAATLMPFANPNAPFNLLAKLAGSFLLGGDSVTPGCAPRDNNGRTFHGDGDSE